MTAGSLTRGVRAASHILELAGTHSSTPRRFLAREAARKHPRTGFPGCEKGPQGQATDSGEHSGINTLRKQLSHP